MQIPFRPILTLVGMGCICVARLIYFTRSGTITPIFGSLRHFARDIFDWSSTAPSGINDTYHFNVDKTNLRPSDYNYRLYGFNVRCFSN